MNYIAKIPKSELIHGEYYNGRCRNATVARWNAEEQVFVHWRTKFSLRYTETIKHPEDEQVYDVFVVDSLCDSPPEVIPLEPEPKGVTRLPKP